MEGVAGDRLCRLVRRVAAWLHRPVAHAAAQDSGPVEAKDDSGCWSSKWTNGYTVQNGHIKRENDEVAIIRFRQTQMLIDGWFSFLGRFTPCQGWGLRGCVSV